MPKSIKQKGKLYKAEKLFRYFFTALSFAGLIISISLHVMFLSNGTRLTESERIAFLVFAFVFSLSGRSIISYIRELPWHGKLFLALISSYSIWYLLTSPFGALDELPVASYKVASYHQAIFLQSFMIGGYTLLCYYWSHIIGQRISKARS